MRTVTRDCSACDSRNSRAESGSIAAQRSPMLTHSAEMSPFVSCSSWRSCRVTRWRSLPASMAQASMSDRKALVMSAVQNRGDVCRGNLSGCIQRGLVPVDRVFKESICLELLIWHNKVQPVYCRCCVLSGLAYHCECSSLPAICGLICAYHEDRKIRHTERGPKIAKQLTQAGLIGRFRNSAYGVRLAPLPDNPGNRSCCSLGFEENFGC